MSPALDRFYAALKALSASDLAACTTADFVLDWQGTDLIPWAGTWRGVDGLLSFVRQLDAHVEILDVQRLHELQDASITVVVLRGHWRLKASNRQIRATACNLFTFKGDKVRSYTVINNSAAFSEGPPADNTRPCADAIPCAPPPVQASIQGPLRLRGAVQADLPCLDALALASKASWGYTPDQIAQWQPDLVVDPATIGTWPTVVAEQDGAIIGFAQLDPTARPWDLARLFVAPAAQRRGVGRRLLRHVQALAAAAGQPDLTIDADPHAAPFYLGCGALQVGEVAAPLPGQPGRTRPQLRLPTVSLLAVYTTLASREDAQALGRSLVEQGLVACAQISEIESLFRWQGAVQQEAEFRLMLKTTAAQYPAVETAIRSSHPYELPAIHALAVSQASAPYADWVEQAVSGSLS